MQGVIPLVVMNYFDGSIRNYEISIELEIKVTKMASKKDIREMNLEIDRLLVENERLKEEVEFWIRENDRNKRNTKDEMPENIKDLPF